MRRLLPHLLPGRFSHGVHANSERALTHTQYKSERQVPRGVQVNASHRITSHRIASHRIVSYRHSPWGHRRVTPLFLPFTMFTYKVARRRKSFQFSLAVCLVAGRFPRSRTSTPRRFSKSAVFVFEISALSDGRLLGNNLPTDRRSFGSHQPICARNE